MRKYSVLFSVVFLIIFMICGVALAAPKEYSSTSWEIDSSGNFVPHTRNSDNIGDSNSYPGTIYAGRIIQMEVVTIPANARSFDASAGNTFITSANTVETVLLDMTNTTIGQEIKIIGGSNTFPTQIADASFFNLNTGWTANVDDVLTLFVQADQDYIESSARVDN